MIRQGGTSMIEVLVTIVILAFGMLGLAGLQARTMNMEMESYQRSQALVILNDMVSRIETPASLAGKSAAGLAALQAYETGYSAPLGGSSVLDDCSGQTIGAARDKCEWGKILNGAAESYSGNRIGAMIGARGCIVEIQAPDGSKGVCSPGLYEVSVAWQGLFTTAAPNNNCGKNLYGDDALRRVISLRVTVGTSGCTP